jgi:hypothetical protein
MTRKMPNFQAEFNENGNFSSMGGALLIPAIFEKFGLRKVLDENINACKEDGIKKYTDSSYIESLVVMQILGGEAVDDIKRIREDGILPEMLVGIPGKTSIHNYINNFVDEKEEEKRGQGKAFVPEPNEHLKGFEEATRHLLKYAPHTKDIPMITLDQDATFIPTGVKGALFSYKSERAFEAFNTYCPEYDMIIMSEYRDGNVPPGYRQLENLQASLELLPDKVEHVRLRSDSAGYQIDLLKYCAEGKSEKFGVIEFAISSPVTKELKQAAQVVSESEWKQIPDAVQECAEVVFVPNSLGTSKRGPEYRFIVIREEISDTAPSELRQMLLLDEEELGTHPILSVHPTVINGKLYKIFALVTNLEWPAEEIVVWHRKRCGKSEELNRVLKEELAGGHVVTSALGANAAWWQITALAFNILTLIKKSCLPEEYQVSRPKKLRYWLFSQVARLGSHARKIIITFYSSIEANLFKSAWARLRALSVQVE